MRRRFALVFNSRAGIALPRLLDAVLADLRDRGAEVFQLPARSADEATERVRDFAASEGADAVIAAGGDGTFRAVAAGLLDTAMPVGFIPIGTGNVLAHELGLGRGAARIAEVLAAGPAIPIQAGTLNGAPFFLMAGAGFDGDIVARLNVRAKRVLGRAAYTGAVLGALAARPRMFDVEINGRRFQANWVIATFAGRYAGSMRLTHDTAIGANRLKVVLVAASRRRDVVRAGLALALGRLTRDAARLPFVDVLSAETLRIGYDTPAPLEVDGDPAGSSPAEVRVRSATVSLIVPQEYADHLMFRRTNRLGSAA